MDVLWHRRDNELGLRPVRVGVAAAGERDDHRRDREHARGHRKRHRSFSPGAAGEGRVIRRRRPSGWPQDADRPPFRPLDPARQLSAREREKSMLVFGK
jgi:hypothetical protein